MRRFYLPNLPERGAAGESVLLEGPEAHHLLHVLRARVGETVELFDGQGRSASARVVACRKRDAELALMAEPAKSPPGEFDLTLATCAPKQERFRWLVEKATELGVARIIPLRTERSVVDPGGGRLEKLQETVIQACKQCGRNDLLTIEPVQTWAEFVSSCASGEKPRGISRGEVASTVGTLPDRRGPELFIASPRGEAVLSASHLAGCGRRPSLVVAVGPEGGLTDDELSRARGVGAQLLPLGPHILRTETAAIAAAAHIAALALSRRSVGASDDA